MHINRKLAAGTRRIVIAALLLGICSFGNAQNVENQIIASQFGQFRLYGVNDGFNFPPASCQLSAGNKNFVAFQQGVPVRVVDTGTPSLSETVIAGPVSIQTCAVSLPVTNFHASFYVTSGTAGLQEAINANGPGSFANTIILDNAWYALGGDSSIISSVRGFSNLGLVDITQTPYVWYSWNGSQYVETSTGGHVSSVFGRTGAVVAQAGDYTCEQVTNCWNAPNQGFGGLLTSSITPTSTTISVTDLQGNPGTEGYFFVDSEWIKYTGYSGGTFTIPAGGRGYFGSTAASHGVNASTWGAILVASNPGQLPNLVIVGSPLATGVLIGINNPFPDSFSGEAAIWFGTTAYLDISGGYHQVPDAANGFAGPVYVGSNLVGGQDALYGILPIENSTQVVQSGNQNQMTQPLGFGGGVAGMVSSIQPASIGAPTLTPELINSGSCSITYEIVGTDPQGNAIPGATATVTGLATPPWPFPGNVHIQTPLAAGVATFNVYRTAVSGCGGMAIGKFVASSNNQYFSFQDFSPTGDGTSPPSSNTSVPGFCVGGSYVSCWVTSATAPTGSCTNGWFDTNQSGTPTTLYQCGADSAWHLAGSGGVPSVNGVAVAPTTVSTLPAASSVPAGTMMVVSDGAGTPPTCTGSGSNYQIAISNGSAWSCH